MLKIFLGFVVFAAIAMYALLNGGADVDMGGEKHGADATHAEAPASAAEAASATASGADAASAPASAASN